jgi:hypothetical protein
MNFHDHILSYSLALLVIIIGSISFYRFILSHDYMVSYEGACDPTLEKCFIGCEDDSCINEYYYSEMQKYAADLYMECGNDITDCESANICLPEDSGCSITYCDEEDGSICKVITNKLDDLQDNDTNI